MKLKSITTCVLVALCLGSAVHAQRYGQRYQRDPRVAQAPRESGSILNSLFRLQQRADDEEAAIESATTGEPETQSDAIDGAIQDALARERLETPEPDTAGPVHIPLRRPDVDVQAENGLVSIIVRDAALKDVVAMIGETLRLNVVCSDTVNGTLSISLERVPLEQALTAITAATGSTWTSHNGIIYVTPLNAGNELSPEVQGRVFQVFELDYVSATDVSLIVAGLLSPVGQSFTVASASDDNRKAREAVVVEDVAPSVSRIANRIAQLDVPPRQVQIEAHVLEVELKDNLRHGVNFNHAFSMMDSSFRLSTTGFASANAQQAFLAEISGPHLSGLIEWLQTATDAKTLASPSLTVLNKQAASIQVGEQLGFRVTTTTDTSTTEGVETLNVGVLLEVTPQITRDGRVLLNVRPEISSGQVNPNTGLPEEEVTELTTDVLLEDGKGIIIGGLIQEKDELNQSKVPWFGDLEHIGKLFGLQDEKRERSEIIIALIPRIVPVGPEQQAKDDMRWHSATSPVIYGALHRAPRPWEPRLPDPTYNPIPIHHHSLGFGCACGGAGSCDSCTGEGKAPVSAPTPAEGNWTPRHPVAAPPTVQPHVEPATPTPPVQQTSSRRRLLPSSSKPARNRSAAMNYRVSSLPPGQIPAMRRFPPVIPEQSATPVLLSRQPHADRRH